MNRRGIIIIAFILAGLMAACATMTRPRPPKAPRGSREPPLTSPVHESAERTASNALVEEGIKAVERGLYDRAADLFQESVTVDSSNGSGYYHLALVKLRTGEYGEVEGLLEKAEMLLQDRPEWTEKLEELRREFHQQKPD